MSTSTIRERLTISGTKPGTLQEDFADAVRTGLTTSPKSLPSRFFYDEKGSQLFEQICELPEYYLTRAEREILRERSREISAMFTEPINLVELGSGNASKTRLLIEALIEAHGNLRYVPVDISRLILEESSLALVKEYKEIEIYALAYEYQEGLQRLAKKQNHPQLILWLGSNVGNWGRPEAATFLRQVRSMINSRDRLLIGIDLRKDRETLLCAYNDAQGVTAEFNKNLLVQINRELGGDFDLNAFRHCAIYDDLSGAVQMFLVSQKAQKISIRVLNLEIEFEPGETIHTENSYKYALEEIETLASGSGFASERQWSDGANLFTVNLLRPLDGK